MVNERIQQANTCAVEVRCVSGYHRKVVKQGNRGNLPVDGVLRALGHQMPPHLCTFMVKIENPVAIGLRDQVEPLFETPSLVEVLRRRMDSTALRSSRSVWTAK